MSSSVQFCRSVISASLWPHGLQHTRLPCPLPASEPAQTHFHQVGDTIQPSHPLSSPSLPAFNLPHHKGLFQRVSSLHQVDKVLEFHWKDWSISPSSEYSGLISFRIDWLGLLEKTLKGLLQHHSSKASILWCSAFFSPTLASIHDYWKNHSFD